MKITIFKCCGLGDAIQITPLLNQIKLDFPLAEITLFTNYSTKLFFNNSPWFVSIIEIPENYFIKKTFFDFVKIWKLMKTNEPYDVFIDLQSGWLIGIGVLIIKSKIKLALKVEGLRPSWIYTRVERYNRTKSSNAIHISQRYLNLWCNHFKTKPNNNGYDVSFLNDLTLSDEEENLLKSIPLDFCILVPGAGNKITPWNLKKWPLSYWKELHLNLSKFGKNCIWLGGEIEKEFINEDEYKYTFFNNYSFGFLCKLITKSEFLISADTGILHLAVSLQKKTISIYGPTDSKEVGPFISNNSYVISANDLNCMPCRSMKCVHPLNEFSSHEGVGYCMRIIKPIDFFNFIKKNI